MPRTRARSFLKSPAEHPPRQSMVGNTIKNLYYYRSSKRNKIKGNTRKVSEELSRKEGRNRRDVIPMMQKNSYNIHLKKHVRRRQLKVPQIGTSKCTVNSTVVLGIRDDMRLFRLHRFHMN
ncbi:hypothetical protein AVEN_229690-1 [Araneus ventricosus]|uniref:Uncharacterized protein n=1 Tax=Araneus ventricosus TaxID=182803 RepID=A0A4Y2IPI5_ARAVE|nr:hypothetical protein AVEN_229690-1 [Araneus ventricosus]